MANDDDAKSRGEPASAPRPSQVMERVIFGAGVVLRTWRRDDGPALELILERSRQAFGDWLPGATKDLADIPAFLQHVEAAFADGTGFFYALEEGGEALGQCSLHHRAFRTGEIGYWVRTDRAGDGIASRAVNALVAAAYGEGLRELVIHCDEGNVRSAHVAANAGFIHVRTVQLDPTLPRTRAQRDAR